MTARRAFLKTAALGLLGGRGQAGAAALGTLHNARALVAGGGLGQIWLCRIPDVEHAGDVKFVLGSRPLPIFEIGPSAEDTVLLGSDATLVMGRRGLRLFCYPTRPAR